MHVNTTLSELKFKLLVWALIREKELNTVGAEFN